MTRLSEVVAHHVSSEIKVSELRTRNWVLAGLLVNMVGWIPAIFFLGSIYKDITNVVSTNKDLESRLLKMEQRTGTRE